MILENEMMKLPASKKKILIDYMNELDLKDRIKVIRQFKTFIPDIINGLHMNLIYVLPGINEEIQDEIKKTRIPYTNVNFIPEPSKHKYSFRSEFLSIKPLMHPSAYKAFEDVLTCSSSVYKNGYNDINILKRLTLVAHSAQKLMESDNPSYVKEEGILAAVRMITVYIIKSNTKIKEVFLYILTKSDIKDMDPVYLIFSKFINSTHPNYRDGRQVIRIFEERLENEPNIEISGINLSDITWLFDNYTRIMNDSTIQNRFKDHTYITMEDYMETFSNHNRYEYAVYNNKMSDEEVNKLIHKAISLESWLQDSNENIIFSLSEKQKAAILIETENFGHITLSKMNENKEFEDWLILVDKGSSNDTTSTAYLLFSESKESGELSSRILGISLSDDPKKSKNKIIFENLDICSEYEIDFNK